MELLGRVDDATERLSVQSWDRGDDAGADLPDWEVFSEEGVSVGGGNFEVSPLGQVQFFPDERTTLPEDFLGSFKATCGAQIHIFSLF